MYKCMKVSLFMTVSVWYSLFSYPNEERSLPPQTVNPFVVEPILGMANGGKSQNEFVFGL